MFLLDQWLPAKVATLKPSTASTYEQMFRSYVVPRIGEVMPGDDEAPADKVPTR